MASITFYHTAGDTPAALDATLPPLLEKIISSNTQALVICPTESRANRLDETLWTFADVSFLPHATTAHATPQTQPVLLTHAEDSPIAHANQRLPVVLAGAEAALEPLLATSPQKILYLFSATQADVARARPLFKSLKQQGHSVQYFQQTATGWQKK